MNRSTVLLQPIVNTTRIGKRDGDADRRARDLVDARLQPRRVIGLGNVRVVDVSGHRRHDDEMLEALAFDLVLDPVELGVADHRSVSIGEYPAAARVNDEQPRPPEIAPVGPHRSLFAIGFPIRRLGEGPQRALGIRQLADELVGLVGREAGRREVADVLLVRAIFRMGAGGSPGERAA